MTKQPLSIHNYGMDICVKAYAKINLTLDVLYKRMDGFHELYGIMQSVDLYDILKVLPAKNNITVNCDCELPYNNTVRKAAGLFLNGGGGASISIKKQIPSEAGLGGASADAAATLIALNRIYRGTELEKTEEQLKKIALAVGADVPFCLTGGCAVAQGVGEKLHPLPVPSLNLLIVKGKEGVSTAKLFKSLDLTAAGNLQIDTKGAVDAIMQGNNVTLGKRMGNKLQSAASRFVPQIMRYCEQLLSLGAIGACMTGSGAAVVGLFASRQDAVDAQLRLMDCDFSTVCQSVACGVEFQPEAK